LTSNTGEASQGPKIALDEAASRRALDAIRRDAVDGLLALPRVGMGVGGFLAGIRRGNRIQIVDPIEIPCTHARGPAFLLTSEELENARTLAARAEPLEVLGLYVSKTRGVLEPGPEDLETLAALCPGVGQIMLMIRPSTVEPVRATLFNCAPGGCVDSPLEVCMDGAPNRPPDLEEAPELSAATAPPPNLALQAVKRAASNSEHTDSGVEHPAQSVRPIPIQSEAVPSALPGLAKEPEVIPGSASRQDSVLFQNYQGKQSPRRAFLYTCGALALMAAAAVAARDVLTARPELTLNIREENGALVFHWNQNAAAGEDHGRLLVNDAGQLHEFPLNTMRIEAGFFRYQRKSDEIVARLVLGDRSAHAVFFGDASAPAASKAISPSDPEKPGESRPR